MFSLKLPTKELGSSSNFIKKNLFSELVKTHIEEVKKLMPSIRRGKSEFVVKYLGVAYDDFRKEVWVRKKPFL
jgi:hypothetical protein